MRAKTPASPNAVYVTAYTKGRKRKVRSVSATFYNTTPKQLIEAVRRAAPESESTVEARGQTASA